MRSWLAQVAEAGADMADAWGEQSPGNRQIARALGKALRRIADKLRMDK